MKPCRDDQGAVLLETSPYSIVERTPFDMPFGTWLNEPSEPRTATLPPRNGPPKQGLKVMEFRLGLY